MKGTCFKFFSDNVRVMRAKIYETFCYERAVAVIVMMSLSLDKRFFLTLMTPSFLRF